MWFLLYFLYVFIYTYIYLIEHKLDGVFYKWDDRNKAAYQIKVL